jgi:hypothetical protein
MHDRSLGVSTCFHGNCTLQCVSSCGNFDQV